MIYVGLDDTDNLESRGTGHLARQIAAMLSADYTVLGVTRHQLLVDPRVPYTKNNSASAILIEDNGVTDKDGLADRIREHMLSDFQEGSDPGLCVAVDPPSLLSDFGRRVQREVVAQEQARALASQTGVILVGLGGDEDGVIGALSAVGLAASGDDGRYVLVGRSRELTGLQPISAILEAGISAVRTQEGDAVTSGMVDADKMRPARRGGLPVLVVEHNGTHWHPLKLD